MSNILVLGASGMLGNSLMNFFSQYPKYKIIGTVRSKEMYNSLPENMRKNCFSGVRADDFRTVQGAVEQSQPDFVINCIGVIKQVSEVKNPQTAIEINALFPHRLSKICLDFGARLIHISTDCVFNGDRGMYKEENLPDAQDLYGLSKRLGEVENSNSITIRTSIIGHELLSNRGLVEWFLSQKHAVRGYSRAIFSGLPTNELARIIDKYILPHEKISGLYHISAPPISKMQLLKIVAKVYQHDIDIVEDNKFIIDRSLDSTKFQKLVGYVPKDWETLVGSMHEFYLNIASLKHNGT